MVETKDIEALNMELDNRLDDLFGESDILLPEVGQEASKQEYPLAELKNSILSIDWEITDEVLDKFLQQIQDLLVTYEEDKIVITFLQILKSLGNYIKIQRGNAPPKAFKIVNSVFSSLDKVVLSEDMTEKAKKKLLRTEMKRYKELREQTAKSQKTAVKGKGKAEAAATDDGEKQPAKRLEKSSENQLNKDKKAKSETEPEEPVVTLESREKEDEPVFTLESREKEEEPVFTLESEDKAEEPVFTLERDEEEEKPLLARDEAEMELASAGNDADREPSIRVKDGHGTRANAGRDTRDKAKQPSRDKAERGSHSKLPPGGEAANLAAAVDEIKRYIHAEIKALKKEIRLLRKQM